MTAGYHYLMHVIGKLFLQKIRFRNSYFLSLDMKKKVNKMSKSASSFWLDEDFLDNRVQDKKGKDPIKLAAYRKAVANFVRIVTGEDIKVKFTQNGKSYTDGKAVTISATLDDKKFDSAVGLALHEGSHIKLTDFNVVRMIDDFIQRKDDYVLEYKQKYQLEDRWMVSNKIGVTLRDLLNIVEDRRIDNFVYKSAPGYRGYYQALYDKYFNSTIIDKGLESDEYRTEEWESYMFRIINITNPKRDLNALKSLRTVWDIMDLANVDRLKSTADALNVAWEIFKAVEESIEVVENKASDSQPDSDQIQEQQSYGNSAGTGTSGTSNEDDTEDGDDDGESADGSEVEASPGNINGGSMPDVELEPLSAKEHDRLQRAIHQQKDFLNGHLKKTGLSKKNLREVEALEAASVDEREVSYTKQSYYGDTIQKQKVVVIKDISKEMIDNLRCDMWSEWGVNDRLEWVNEGIIFGTALGKKLKVRDDEKSTKYNRLRSGRIDKRMIAAAGYGAEGIFEKIETFAYRPGMIHISIDNSGSMSGHKFRKTIVSATAIAKACSMIDNMECVISFRSTATIGDQSYHQALPTIVIAYDSRRDSIMKMRTIMPFMNVCGGTPEGLCFDAVMKEILDGSNGKDAYFVNFSDGQPYCGNYHGVAAYTHTKKQVDKMVNNNIKVISYFITESRSSYGHDEDVFKTMYGKDASFIDVTKMREVAGSINKKFLQV